MGMRFLIPVRQPKKCCVYACFVKSVIDFAANPGNTYVDGEGAVCMSDYLCVGLYDSAQGCKVACLAEAFRIFAEDFGYCLF